LGGAGLNDLHRHVTIENASGNGPALRVTQSGVGANYPIADFYDNDVNTTVPALRIADGGNVGMDDRPAAKATRKWCSSVFLVNSLNVPCIVDVLFYLERSTRVQVGCMLSRAHNGRS